MTFQTAIDLCPNFQKPPLPSKIPGYAPATPDDLSKLRDVIRNKVVKKAVYYELVKNVHSIQTTDTSNLVKRAVYNTKIAKNERKLLDHNHGKYINTQESN